MPALALLLAMPAHAAIFLEVGPGLTVPWAQGHNWIRTFPDEEGWWFCHGAGGDYLVNHIDDDLALDEADPVFLTGRSDLIDMGIARCPDGGYLHASFSQVEGRDTLHTFRYDQGWTRLAEGVVFEDDPVARGSDMPVLCSAQINATAYSEGPSAPFILAVLDDLGALVRTQPLTDAPASHGSSLEADPDTGTFLVIGTAMNGGRDLMLRRYAIDDLALVESRTLEHPFDSSRRVFWPQGLARVGDHHILAYVVTTEASGTAADTGDIWLSAYDADWNLVESTAVVEEPTEWWAWMRPGLARKGDRLLVSFDNMNNIFLAEVTLDLAALGVTGEDSGDPDTDTPTDDSGDGPGDSAADAGDPEGCGCGSAGTAPLAVLFALLGLARRGGRRDLAR